MKKVSVKLPAKDWRDLYRFVDGDLACMPSDCEIRAQMRRILDKIDEALAVDGQNGGAS